MAAQHARSASEPLSGAAQTHPQYFKAGTIERIFDDCGAADGRQLPFQSKAIAAFLILKAQKNRGYTCVLPEREICATLAIDGKTFRKYLAPLVEANLVLINKSRRDATRCFDCKPLFKRYGEETAKPTGKVTEIFPTTRSGILSRTNADKVVGKTTPSVRETVLAASGNEPTSLRESIPNPNYSSYFLISTSDLNGVFESRFGKEPPPGCDRELRVMLCGFDLFQMSERRQRALVKRYGIYAVADAIAYVLAQQELTKIDNPAGFVTFALERGLHADAIEMHSRMERRSGKVSHNEERPDAPQPDAVGFGIVSQTAEHEDRVVGDLWEAALSYLETRLSAAELNMLVRPARPVSFDEGVLTLEAPSAWARDRLNERCSEAIKMALETLIGPQITLDIVYAGNERSVP